jgi:hypothetical protein
MQLLTLESYIFFHFLCRIFSVTNFSIEKKEIKTMTILKCNATSCTYNKDMLCSKGEIDVMGESAHNADETSCGSFRERTTDSMTNSTASGCGCEKIQIDCKAQNCTYNENCKCTAAAINVGGSNASTSDQTKCDTFSCCH